jgi:nicotinamide riboside transporter PnuC
MVDLGWMDEAGSQADKRQRTIWLLSVCLNIVAIQFFNKRKFRNTQKGIAVFTVLAAFGWVFYYYKSLFFVE